MGNGFEKTIIRSIRGLGYEKEDLIYNIENEKIFHKIIEQINDTSDKQSIIDMCGHAIYAVYKKYRKD